MRCNLEKVKTKDLEKELSKRRNLELIPKLEQKKRDIEGAINALKKLKLQDFSETTFRYVDDLTIVPGIYVKEVVLDSLEPELEKVTQRLERCKSGR